jgi:hypothetical protein
MKKIEIAQKLILYSPFMNSYICKLTQILEKSFRTSTYEVYTQRKEFQARLQRRQNICAVTLVAPTQHDLNRILQLQDLLDGLHLLLVLPDQETDTISRAHRLRPRFLTYADSDLAEITAVLLKIANNKNRVQTGDVDAGQTELNPVSGGNVCLN